MEHTLNGKIALVTGGGRGIGAAIALRMARLGATTIVCGRTLARLQHTAGQIRSAGGQAEPLACDVADWNSVAALADRVQKSFWATGFPGQQCRDRHVWRPAAYHAHRQM